MEIVKDTSCVKVSGTMDCTIEIDVFVVPSLVQAAEGTRGLRAARYDTAASHLFWI